VKIIFFTTGISAKGSKNLTQIPLKFFFWPFAAYELMSRLIDPFPFQ
jgi:hypothetical protein